MSPVDPSPITYRILLSDAEIRARGLDPSAPVTCNCHFDEGHEATCDLVAAHAYRARCKTLAPGVWIDPDGELHFAIPDILAYLDLPDTPAHREGATATLRAMLAELAPHTKVIERP